MTFPDLPGCFSAADRIADVLPKAYEALELWFEDTQIVEPGDMAEIAMKVADDLAAGAFILAVLHVTAANRPTRVNISLNRGTLEAIDAAASSRRLTRSTIIAEAARNEIQGAH